MNDKLLFENWRKFLAEREEIAAPAEKSLPGATINDFLKYLKALSKQAQRGKAQSAGVQMVIGLTGKDVVVNGFRAMDLIARGFHDQIDFGEELYEELPWLAHLNIDQVYKDLFQNEVIVEFLQQYGTQLKREGFKETDEMPDIDVMLEIFVIERTKKRYDIDLKLDGVTDARDEFKAWYKPEIHSLGGEYIGREIQPSAPTRNVIDKVVDYAATGGTGFPAPGAFHPIEEGNDKK